MRNDSQPISDPSAIHLLHIRHHDGTSNSRPLKLGENSEGMHADSPAIFMVALFALIRLDALPIFWVVHGYICRQGIPCLCSDDVG